MPQPDKPPKKPIEWNPISPLFDSNWRFCLKLSCSDPARLEEEPAGLCGAAFISISKGDWQKRRELRQLLAGQYYWSVCRMPDEELFQFALQLLASGRLHIHAKLQPRTGAYAISSGRSTSKAAAPVKTPKSSTSSSVSGSLDNEPSTFNRNLDGASQAAALIAAAQSGTPFCAECDGASESGGDTGS